MASETSKYRHLVTQYCNGNGCDIGSQGDPVVPWAIQIDLPQDEYAKYSGGSQPATAIHYRVPNAATDLPFRNDVLDFVYSSHLLEDFRNWSPVLLEWTRVLKRGGNLVIILPDKQRWEEAMKLGHPPNDNHTHETFVGELSSHSDYFEWKVIEDRLTNVSEGDYSILFVAQKI